MSRRKQLYRTVLVFLMATGAVAKAGDSGRSPESDLAAPGAALYEIAVTESIRSLMTKEEQAEGRPPSPGPDYFWCENCKTYHKTQPGAAIVQPAVAQSPGAVPAGTKAGSLPPSPGEGYYWCEQCKTYHVLPASAQQPGAARTVPQTNGVVPATGAVGAPISGDYYYCEQCKTYHRRTPEPQKPAPTVSHIFGGTSNHPVPNPIIGPAGAGH
jgi:hypothetical protein